MPRNRLSRFDTKPSSMVAVGDRNAGRGVEDQADGDGGVIEEVCYVVGLGEVIRNSRDCAVAVRLWIFGSVNRRRGVQIQDCVRVLCSEPCQVLPRTCARRSQGE
jgi:hypothetical protein